MARFVRSHCPLQLFSGQASPAHNGTHKTAHKTAHKTLVPQWKRKAWPSGAFLFVRSLLHSATGILDGRPGDPVAAFWPRRAHLRTQ